MRALFLPLTLSLALGCVARDPIPVRGDLGPYAIATTVDSDDARYYLEDYLGRRQPDPARDDDLRQHLGGLTAAELKALADRYSPDLAALHFGHQILQRPENAAVQAHFLEKLAQVRRGGVQVKSGYRFLFVPGLDYVEHGHATGADFAAPRQLLQQLGVSAEVVPIPSLGSVPENAAIIRQHLERQTAPVILVGASSGGPAIHLALGEGLTEAARGRVAAWINVGGILRGSPLLDWVTRGLPGLIFATVLWWNDWPAATFDSMKTEVLRRQFERLQLPENLLTINYVGLSLSGDISRFARDQYQLMRGDGPNDGLALLPDMLAPAGVTLLAPRSDHFFAEDPEIDRKTVAILLVVLERLAARKAARRDSR